MKTDAPAIAKTELVRIRKNGDHVSVSIEVGQPYKTTDGVWCTPVALHGVDGRLPGIFGEDSLQSLCLAIEFIRARLEDVVEAGDRLIDSKGPDEGVDFAIGAYFPKR